MTDKEKLIELLCKAHNAVTDKSLENQEEWGMTYAEQIETETDSLIANGVTIPVRCKDCKHNENCDALLYCGHTKGLAGSVSPDGFCSYGERRTDEASR